jgi:hypothetical protein
MPNGTWVEEPLLHRVPTPCVEPLGTPCGGSGSIRDYASRPRPRPRPRPTPAGQENSRRGCWRVLLMVVFGVVEFRGGQNFGGDQGFDRFRQHALIGLARGFCLALMRVGIGIDRQAVLRALTIIPALPWVGSWFPQNTFRSLPEEIFLGSNTTSTFRCGRSRASRLPGADFVGRVGVLPPA